LDCIFCNIINKSASSYVIYEDEEYIAFLDKYPISIGHTLVLPKKHFPRVNDMSQAQFCALYSRVYRLNHEITTRLGATASHISINDGGAANQLIPHVHVHIIPRVEKDNAGFAARKLLQAQEMEDIRRKLALRQLDFTS
jgi:histidine triad (HIT) family protein